MSNASEYGPNLMRYVYGRIEALGMTPTGWASAHGVNIAQLGRWRDGNMPRLDGVAEVAQALGMPVIELLAVAVGVEPGQPYAPAPAPAPSLEAAIESDESLTESMRVPLRDIVRAMRAYAVEHGD